MGLFFGSTPPGALFNLLRTGVHAAQGTLGQHGPATSPIGRLLQLLNPNFGQPGGTPSPTVQTPGASNPDAPYYPPVTNTGPGGNTPPASLPGGLNPGQAAWDAQTAEQTNFQNLQDSAVSNFYRPDELPTPNGPPVSRVSPYFGLPSAAARSYQAQFPQGSTVQQILDFNQRVASGVIPSFQQFAGLPAYQPPGAATPAPALLQAFLPKAGTTTSIHA